MPARYVFLCRGICFDHAITAVRTAYQITSQEETEDSLYDCGIDWRDIERLEELYLQAGVKQIKEDTTPPNGGGHAPLYTTVRGVGIQLRGRYTTQ